MIFKIILEILSREKKHLRRSRVKWNADEVCKAWKGML